MNTTKGSEEFNQVERLKSILVKNNLSISVAESCTGGNLQSLLTSTNGSSEYFEGGICCYNIDQKFKHLSVDKKIAKPVDCVSLEVAEQMVIGCSKLFESNVSVATTGFIQSHLYYSICVNNEVLLTERLDLDYPSRQIAQVKGSEKILKVLVKLLDNKYSPNSII